MNELQGLSPLKLIPPPFHKFLPLNVQIRYSAINGTNTCMFSEKITKTVIIFNLISKNYIPCCYYKSGEKSLSERAFTFKLGMRPILRDRQDFFKEECKYKSALLFKSYKSGIFSSRAAACSSRAFVFFFFRLLALVSFCWFFTSATMV